MVSRKEAMEAGLERYFTGKPCKSGHIAERYVNDGHCLCCNAEKNKKYRQDNKEKVAEQKKKYYIDNKEYFYLQFKLRQKRLRKATPSWFESEVDEIKEIYLECKKLNDEAGYIKYHVDHVIPLKNKKVCGLHTISNLQIITAEKNLSKRNKLLPQHITESK